MITQAVKQTISGRRHNIILIDLRAARVIKVIPLLVNWILSKSRIVPPTDTTKMVAHCETIVD
jgi:hypothetical protein